MRRYKILVTGATGFIGHVLCEELKTKGHEVVTLSRTRGDIQADLSREPVTSEKLSGIDVVFNLMGEPIAEGRWTEAKKNRLRDSRIKATKNLLASFKKKPKILISSSAIGIYGDRGDEELTEESACGTDFLAELCKDWEKAALGGADRVVLVRTGLVLSREGGALAKMLPPFRAGLGGPLGSGNQWMSWIDLRDMIRALLFCMENEISGPVNFVAGAVRNSEFTERLGKALSRPAILPVPRAGLRLLFGEKAQILLDSQKVIPKKLLNCSFSFQFKNLSEVFRCELT